MSLGLMPERALLNDVNPHLMNFYHWIGQGFTIDIEMENDEALYYAHRERFNELIRAGEVDSSEAAQLFYYLNRTGYNGLCRFNSKGGYNVPFGKYKNIAYAREFSRHSSAFASWSFSVGDFQDIGLSGGDFIYADPPYDVEFTTYSQGGFSWNDQVETAEWLACHRGPVILVNQATDRVVGLYERLGFSVGYLDAPRRIACTGDRAPAREVFATRNL